jgi:hypothetical protein
MTTNQSKKENSAQKTGNAPAAKITTPVASDPHTAHLSVVEFIGQAKMGKDDRLTAAVLVTIVWNDTISRQDLINASARSGFALAVRVQHQGKVYEAEHKTGMTYDVMGETVDLSKASNAKTLTTYKNDRGAHIALLLLEKAGLRSASRSTPKTPEELELEKAADKIAREETKKDREALRAKQRAAKVAAIAALKESQKATAAAAPAATK